MQVTRYSTDLFDVAPDKGFPEAQAAQVMRDDTNPSLDTTISAAGFLSSFIARFTEQCARLRASPELVPNAVVALVRLVSPIRAFAHLPMRIS